MEFNYEDNFKEISEHLGCKLETVKSTYEELQTKECIQNDPDEERVLDCLYEILLDKTMQVSRKNEIINDTSYFATNDYFINKAILNTYGEEALSDISDAYLSHLTTDIVSYSESDHYQK